MSARRSGPIHARAVRAPQIFDHRCARNHCYPRVPPGHGARLDHERASIIPAGTCSPSVSGSDCFRQTSSIAAYERLRTRYVTSAQNAYPSLYTVRM